MKEETVKTNSLDETFEEKTAREPSLLSPAGDVPEFPPVRSRIEMRARRGESAELSAKSTHSQSHHTSSSNLLTLTL